LTVLASSAPAAGQVVTGVLGFLVVAGMGVALFFLLRSMNKQLRKVMPEPRWREEAHEGQEARDGQEALPGQPEQDYSRNGSGQPG
jgi:large-conductance mechanosensitive channel